MSIKLFILGRPGSGKSTAYHHIEEYLRQQYKGWSVTRYNDYEILQEMFLFEKLFLQGKKEKQFEASMFDGFNVRDFTVLDTALITLEKRVREISSHKKDELIIIEFARQDYIEALNLFSPSFLKDAYFLFLNADVKICVQRVKKRVNLPLTPDNHFVSENILTGYYGKQIIPPVLKTRGGLGKRNHSVHIDKPANTLVSAGSRSTSHSQILGPFHSFSSAASGTQTNSLRTELDKSRVRMVANQGTLQDFDRTVENFIDHVFASTFPAVEKDLSVRLTTQHGPYTKVLPGPQSFPSLGHKLHSFVKSFARQNHTIKMLL